MSNHLNDADLVALALLPDEPADTRLHLAACADCQARMDAAIAEIERQRAVHDSSVESRDATFWKRQELSIMREVSRSDRSSLSARRGFIAAAILTVALGGFWFGRTSVDQQLPRAGGPVAETTVTSPAPEQEIVVPATSVSTATPSCDKTQIPSAAVLSISASFAP